MYTVLRYIFSLRIMHPLEGLSVVPPGTGIFQHLRRDLDYNPVCHVVINHLTYLGLAKLFSFHVTVEVRSGSYPDRPERDLVEGMQRGVTSVERLVSASPVLLDCL